MSQLRQQSTPREILPLLFLASMLLINCGGGGGSSSDTSQSGNSANNNQVGQLTEPYGGPTDNSADTAMTVFANAVADDRWDQGIGAYDAGIDHSTCDNDGGAGCPNISWVLVADSDRGDVLQIVHSDAGTDTGFYIQSSTAFDASAFAGGNILFDIQVISGDSNFSMKLDCDYPCGSEPENLGSLGTSGWETVSVPVNNFVATGLQLDSLTTGIVIWASLHTNTVFQLDNIRWETGDGSMPVDINTSPLTYEGYSLVWSDDFSGNSLNTSNWNYETGDGCPYNCGWGNEELEFYSSDNTSVSDGLLIIEAREQSLGGRSYTSSRLTTQGKQFFTYGRFDIRAKLPEGQGLWPALWMIGENFSSVAWPASGEIDIMEMVGGSSNNEKTTHGTIHYANASNNHQYVGGSKTISNGTLADDFHVFSLDWTSDSISWLIDGVSYHTEQITSAERTEFHEDFFFIFNVAVGGQWPGNPDGSTQFPQQMQVDYIRVFQLD
ncbi:family 16 glycosylhydrolase [SAR92 clade bacterium H246]